MTAAGEGSRPDVSIIVVSFNDAEDLRVSLTSALAQRGVSREVIVVDNASRDGSREVAEKLGVSVVALPENVGFAAGMNAGIEASAGRYVLALNPDCRLEPDFAAVLGERIMVAATTKKTIGTEGQKSAVMATYRILRYD